MQTRSPRRFAPLDMLVVLAVLCAGAAVVPALMSQGPAATVRILRDSEVVAEYDISDSVDVVVDGHEGPLRVRVQDQQAWISYSSCRRQVCVRAGAISKPGQQLICAPNHVVVEVCGNEPGERPDAVTQ